MVPEPPLRAAFLDAVAANWSGWTVRWACGGMDDLADYPRLAPSPPEFERFTRETSDGGPPAGGRLVLTVDRIAYPIEKDDLSLGPSLLDRLPDVPGPLDPQPRGGVHLDVEARRAGMWTTGSYEGFARSWPTLWPGWTLELWKDDHTKHTACNGTRFDAVTPDPSAYGQRLDDLWFAKIAELLREPVFYAFATRTSDAYIRPYRDLGLSTEQYQILRERAVGTRSDEAFARAYRECMGWANAAAR